MKYKKYKRQGHKHVSIDYYAYLSGLKCWNASYKVIFTVVSLFTVIFMDSIRLSAMTMLFMGGMTIFIGKVKWKDYIRLLLVPAAFILMSGIAILIQFGSGRGSVFSIPFFSVSLFITEESLQQAGTLSIKALGAVSCLYLLTLSTPMGEIVSVFKKLHVPGIILELMHFIYRYIFLLLDINGRQKEAVKSRLGYCDSKNAVRVFGAEIANLFIISMNRARDYYDALESRGYEGNCLFFEEKRAVTYVQLLWGAAYLILAIVMI